MYKYILKRLLFIIPTLFVVILLNFTIVQFAPGGPVENMIAKLKGVDKDAGEVSTASGAMSDAANGEIDDELIEKIKKTYGFDKPAHERFKQMVMNYLVLDLGESYYRNQSVTSLILEKLPVSLSLGFWSTLLIYLISIPLGIRKAISNGGKFDTLSSVLIVIAFSFPSFVIAILGIILFGPNGMIADLFPLRGLTSANWNDLTFMGKILDYVNHIILPVFAIMLSGFATLTMLTKNSFLEEIRKQYVLTARAKGLNQRQVMYGHVFRNAMLVVVAGIPDAIIKIFFAGSILIETIFSLDGIGLLSYESAITRDYPVLFGSLFVFTLIGLLVNLITDIVYTMIDPRIDFNKKNG